jgi:hypothetical protein
MERLMKYALLLVLVACSSKKRAEPPPPAPTPVAKPDAPVAIPRPTMKSSQPIDLPDAGITGLQLVPIVAMHDGSAAAEKGVFDIRWREPKRHDSGIVCRIESYNLAYFGEPDLDEGAKPDEHEVLYRPDPFVLEPKVCEVRFLDDHHAVIARACYQDGTMTAGACPAGTFPPPKLPDGMAVGVQGASAHQSGNSTIQIKALFTVARPLADEPSFALRCDGNTSKPDEGEGFVPLSRLAAGESLYTWKLAPFMNKPVTSDPKQCELRIFTKKRTLGTACIAEGSTEPGPCPK